MKRLKALFILIVLALLVSVPSGCGGNGGIRDGLYLPKDPAISVTFSSFKFKGKKVTIGMVGGMMQYTVPYTYTKGTNGNPGTLSFDLSSMAGGVSGMATNMPCEIDGRNLKLGGFVYVKQ